MLSLILEVLASVVPTSEPTHVIRDFTDAITESELFRREDTQQAAERVLHILREARVSKPDLHVPYALASCLVARFQRTHVINDFEEAMGYR